MKKITAIIMALAMLFSLAACSSGEATTAATTAAATTAATSAEASQSAAGGTYKVAVILKALDSEFWMDAKAGAEEAGKALGITVDVKAPDKESNVEQQFKIIEDCISQGYDALAIAPCDSAGVVPIIEDASAKGIPVVTIDTDADTDAKLSFIGTDNKAGGAMAAARMIELLKDKQNAKVAMITGVPGQQTMRDRSEGFKTAIAAAKNITLVTEQPADSDPGKALTVMENILTTYPDLDGVFILNATMTIGSLEAVANANSKVKIIGFDSSSDALKAVKDGKVDSVIAQSPYNMGKYSVETLKKILNKENYDKRVDTGTELITAENVDQYLK
jgi:ribose transport system substrate-binding protein